MATPSQVDTWVGLDGGKDEHFADFLDNDGERLFGRAPTTSRTWKRCWTGLPGIGHPGS